MARHERIKNKLIGVSKDYKYGCFPVLGITSKLGMAQRTVKARLRIIGIANSGVFVNPEEKGFCTREGLILLANKLGLKEPAAEQES